MLGANGALAYKRLKSCGGCYMAWLKKLAAGVGAIVNIPNLNELKTAFRLFPKRGSYHKSSRCLSKCCFSFALREPSMMVRSPPDNSFQKLAAVPSSRDPRPNWPVLLVKVIKMPFWKVEQE